MTEITNKTRQDKTRQDKRPPYAQDCQVVVLGQMDNTLDHTFESANRVYDKNQLCPTIPTCGGGGIQPKVIEETRCVGGLNDKQWGKQYHQQDRVYKGDIALAQPANLPGGSYNYMVEENMSERQNNIKAKKLPNGNIRFYRDDEKKSAVSELQVQSKDNVAQTITTANVPKIYEEKYIVAMRGRNPQNPNDRTTGAPTEQRLEVNMNGTSNTLTTVQKDNLVLEKKIHTLTKQELVPCKLDKMPEGKLTSLNNAKLCDVDTKTASTITSRYYKGIAAHKDNMCIEIKQATKEGSIKCKVGGCYDASFPGSTTRRGRVQEGGDVAPTLTAGSNENIRYVETIYRIRKLTPRECWRLMGYTDTDFDKANEVNSATQLYKQAGNAIVKQVLMAIFAQMIPESARKL